jgi:hypothetical protein
MTDFAASDAPDVVTLRRDRPVARKEHVCDLCRRPILVGQRYDRMVFLDRDQSPAKIVSQAYHGGYCREDLDQ